MEVPTDQLHNEVNKTRKIPYAKTAVVLSEINRESVVFALTVPHQVCRAIRRGAKSTEQGLGLRGGGGRGQTNRVVGMKTQRPPRPKIIRSAARKK